MLLMVVSNSVLFDFIKGIDILIKLLIFADLGLNDLVFIFFNNFFNLLNGSFNSWFFNIKEFTFLIEPRKVLKNRLDGNQSPKETFPEGELFSGTAPITEKSVMFLLPGFGFSLVGLMSSVFLMDLEMSQI
jgi:hypothetical protein